MRVERQREVLTPARLVCSVFPSLINLWFPTSSAAVRAVASRCKEMLRLLKKIELRHEDRNAFRRSRPEHQVLESLLDVRIDARGQDLTIDGDPKDVETRSASSRFRRAVQRRKTFTDRELREAFARSPKTAPTRCATISPKRASSFRQKAGRAETPISAATGSSSKQYLVTPSARLEREELFGVAMAVQALSRAVSRIVLARPAVEAGERLGFCPAICRRRLIRICPALRPLSIC